GMFFWTAAAFLRELEHARPVIADATCHMAQALLDGDTEECERTFNNLEDISIDYALMEHARKVLMVRGAFPWEDVGAWPALQQGSAEPGENFTLGDPVVYDCS